MFLPSLLPSLVVTPRPSCDPNFLAHGHCVHQLWFYAIFTTELRNRKSAISFQCCYAQKYFSNQLKAVFFANAWQSGCRIEFVPTSEPIPAQCLPFQVLPQSDPG